MARRADGNGPAGIRTGRTGTGRIGKSRIAGGVLVGLASLAAAIVSDVLQQQRLILLASEVPAQLAPIPAGSLPAGAALPPPSAPLTAAQHRTIARAMWRDPLDDQLLNLLYTDALRVGAPSTVTRRDADLLSRLGWRFTPTQQNLIIRAALDERFGEVADHADALLRRQKLPSLGYAMLQAMEGLPQSHDYVVAKLRADPPWRRDYLSVIGPQDPPALLAARTRTLDTLLRAPRGVSRDEMAPSLAALAGSGNGRAAYAIWLRQTARSRTVNLVYDPSFRQAATLAGASGPAIPFEWQFGTGVGYSAQPSPEGVDVDWDRHGVPTFLSQVVPVVPGHGYVLRVRGSGGGAPLSALLAPTISCGVLIVRPDDVRGPDGEARYIFSALPPVCDTGLLTINGATDAGMGSIGFHILDVNLQRAS